MRELFVSKHQTAVGDDDHGVPNEITYKPNTGGRVVRPYTVCTVFVGRYARIPLFSIKFRFGGS